MFEAYLAMKKAREPEFAFIDDKHHFNPFYRTILAQKKVCQLNVSVVSNVMQAQFAKIETQDSKDGVGFRGFAEVGLMYFTERRR